MENRTVAATVLAVIAATGLVLSARRLAAAPSRRRPTCNLGDENE
jgi:hypothetical protein